MSEKSKELCAYCGKVFLAGKYSFVCPTCKKRIYKEAAIKREQKKREQKNRGKQ